MTKEELLEKMSEERPYQKLIEIVDFRPSKSGIEGVLYDVDVLVEHRFIYESNYQKVHYNMPYPLEPYKKNHDKKIKKMLDNSKDVFNVLQKTNNNYTDALVSIYDYLKIIDNEIIEKNISIESLELNSETLSEMFLGRLEAYGIDLNKDI